MSTDFAETVAKLCYDKFRDMPKAGIPQTSREWTLLAGIVLSFEDPDKNLTVVSLCTGTKCLGYDQLAEDGNVISDSHAEVLARRAFKKFMYHHASDILEGKSSEFFQWDARNSKMKMKGGIKVHLFISHVPCGDAAIFPKETTEKRPLSSNLDFNDKNERIAKKIKMEESVAEKEKSSEKSNDLLGKNVPEEFYDIHRTGAKCVENGQQDPKEAGANYHIVGALRTKPGRGSPTWSMSCSDKIALWNVCGLQGALLSLVISEPIYLSSIVFGKCPFNKEAIERAILGRLTNISKLPLLYKVNEPKILQSTIPFEYSKEIIQAHQVDSNKIMPFPASVVWCYYPSFVNVIILGSLQGATKKDRHKTSARSVVSKSVFLKDFLSLCKYKDENARSLRIRTDDKSTYLDFKRSAETYQLAKQAVFTVFDGWKRKPDSLQKFTPDNVLKVKDG